MESEYKEPEHGRMLGEYRVLHTVGSGGMGVVYAVWDTRLERRVALKMVHPHLLVNPGGSQRFLREARAAARIEHPNVVRIYRVDQIGDALAIEMQYIEGKPLSILLRPVPLPACQAADLLHQVLTALAACHAQGVIHCDLKPSNLLVNHDGHIYLTDFGIARALQLSGSATDAPTLTTGPMWGTPRYTPPEAWKGEDPSPAWDLYSLGVMTYEALAARPAFGANTPASLMHQILAVPPAPLDTVRDDLSEEFVHLVHALMAREPQARPESAARALALLHRTREFELTHAETQPLRAAEPLPALPAGRPTGGQRPARGGSWRALITVAFVGCALAVLTWWQATHPAAPRLPSPTASGPEASAISRTETAAVPVAASPALPSLPEPMELTAAPEGVYFAYDDGIHGSELWYASPGGQAELVRDLVPGPGSSRPHYFLHRAGIYGLVFTATTDEYGEELWFCRMLAPGEYHVFLIKDIIPGQMGSEPRAFDGLDNVFFFYATTLYEGRELWITSTREQQTAMITDLFPGTGGSALMGPKGLLEPRGLYFFGLTDAEFGQQLFHYNHDTVQVRLVANVFEDVGPMALADDTLVLTNKDELHGVEPWIHHPDRPGIELLADLQPGSQSSDPGEHISWKGKVYFSARTDSVGQEPWVTDGTAEGTVLLADVHPGPEGSSPFAFVSGGERLFFRATTRAEGNELWVTDGTREGTRIVVDAWPGPESGKPYNVVAIGERVLFTVIDPAYGEELWMADLGAGTPARRITDLWPGPNGSEPHNLRAISRSSGLFTFKNPALGPALGIVDLNVDPPDIRTIELPHASKESGEPES